MPLYDYRCKVCGFEFEGYQKIEYRYSQKCPECGGGIEIQISSKIEVWKPEWWEDIAPEPIYIESKKQLKEECKKRGVYAKGY